MPDHPTPLLAAALMIEAVFCLAGLAVWGLVVLRPSVRNRPARLAPWPVSFSDFLACALFVVGGAFLLPLLVNIVVDQLPHRMLLSGDARTLVFGIAMHLGAIGGAIGAWVYLRLQHKLAAGRGRLDATQIAGPLAGVLTFLGVLPITFLGGLLFSSVAKFLHLPLEPQETLEILIRLKSRPLIVLFFVLATVIAPVMEELVFRAGLFRFLRTFAPRWVALLLPALFFASLHVDWKTLDGLNSFIPLAALAIVFSLAYERTGRIGVTMIAHALFNLNMILLVLAGMPT